MRAISLFSGVGGFELGFERAGIETVLQAERDPWCLEVLARHWPGTERVTDVRSVGVSNKGSRRNGEERGLTSTQHRADSASGVPQRIEYGTDGIDLVYGGFPCQDLSVAGKRAGLGGERSGEWFEFERVLRELRPRWAVIENVPGLLSSNRGDDFAVILGSLDELGFDAAWAVLDAQHFGVPQRRRRVFVVAGPRGRGPEQVLSLCESCGGNPETGRAQGEGTTGALAIRTPNTGSNGWGVGVDEQAYTLDGAQGQAGVASAISASAGHHGHSSPRGDGSDNLIAHTLHARDGKGINAGHGENNLVVGALTAAMGGQTVPGNTQVDAGQLIPATASALTSEAYHHGGYGNQTVDTDGLLLPIAGVRRLTPRECERLQGWPDDHTRWTADGREIADSHRYRMAGNGVASPCAEWIGHRLVAVDRMLS